MVRTGVSSLELEPSITAEVRGQVPEPRVRADVSSCWSPKSETESGVGSQGQRPSPVSGIRAENQNQVTYNEARPRKGWEQAGTGAIAAMSNALSSQCPAAARLQSRSCSSQSGGIDNQAANYRLAGLVRLPGAWLLFGPNFLTGSATDPDSLYSASLDYQ